MFTRPLNAERPEIKLSRPIGNCQEIKQRISIQWLWRYHNLPGDPKPGGRCLSPFYVDNNPDFWISRDGTRFFDHGQPDHRGDCINFEVLASGCTCRDAIRKLRELANLPANQYRQQIVDRGLQPRQQRDIEKLRPRSLDFVERGSMDDLKRLAELRCLSLESLTIARDVGVLRFATRKGLRAWIVTDKTCFLFEARRLDGQKWQHINAKAWTLPGGTPGCKKWPVGICEAQECRAIALVEGGPDFLAAYHFLVAEDRHDIAPVAMLGGSLPIHEAAFPFFATKRVRIFAHHDKNGVGAACRWEAQLKSVGAIVDCFDFSGLKGTDGQAVSDLNDLCRIGCDEWETEVREIMP